MMKEFPVSQTTEFGVSLLDPAQLVDRRPARNVDDIVAKLFLQAWRGQVGPNTLGRMQVISDPTEAYDLLSRPDAFPKFYSFLTLLGRSRFDADGADWEMRRDLTQPLYREAARTVHHGEISACYARWLTQDAVLSGRIERALLGAASEVFLTALGGTVQTGPVADWIIGLRQTAIVAQHIAMFDPSAQQFTLLQQAVADLRGDLRDILARDRALLSRFGGLISNNDNPFDLLGEVTLNLFAGTETTVASVCWALQALAHRPAVQESLAAAVGSGHRESPELTAFIQEVMRFFPPVPLLVRQVRQPAEKLAGRAVTQGQTIALSIVGLHHHRDHWDTPMQFKAARSAFVNNTYHRRAYLPFSAGPRVCGGLGLARAEMMLALKYILKNYRISSKDTSLRFEWSLTLRPTGIQDLNFEAR